ncbi:hypothetical protein MMC09_001119 [Bachmanniomyces sp. S44760]|nr:hypothetical protein [Bachmanniomyces sp. S44760]
MQGKLPLTPSSLKPHDLDALKFPFDGDILRTNTRQVVGNRQERNGSQWARGRNPSPGCVRRQAPSVDREPIGLALSKEYSVSQPELSTTIQDSEKSRMDFLGSQNGGDTQPLSQSAYEEFSHRNKIAKSLYHSPTRNSKSIPPELSPCTYETGQTGHVDLVGAFEQGEEAVSEDEDEDLAISGTAGGEDSEMTTDLYPESKRFRQPKTPATNEKGTRFLPNSITPNAPINPFAGHELGDVGVMDLSQVFKATQAPSSPLPAALPSDFLSDRPSPNMYYQRRPSTADRSSPPKAERRGLTRSVTEPHAVYISMKDSQAARERRLEAERQASGISRRGEYDSDSDEPEDSMIRRRLNQKKIELEARNQFLGITASARPGSSGRNRKSQAGGGHVMRPNSARQDQTLIISDDAPKDREVENASEEETEHEEGGGGDESEFEDELAEDNKENIAVRGVQVPRTTSKLMQRAVRATNSSPTMRKTIKNLPQFPDEVDELANDGVVARHTSSAEDVEVLPKTSQPIAVADSQPSQTKRIKQQRGNSQTRPATSSSGMPDIVPQSQSHQVDPASHVNSSMARHLARLDAATAASHAPSAILDQNHSPQPLAAYSSIAQSIQKNQIHVGSNRVTRESLGLSTLASSPPDMVNIRSNMDSPSRASALDSSKNRDASSHLQLAPAMPEVSHEVSLVFSRAITGQDSSGSVSDLNMTKTTHHPSYSPGLKSTIPETGYVERHARREPSPSRLASSDRIATPDPGHSNLTSNSANQQVAGSESAAFHTANTHVTQLSVPPHPEVSPRRSPRYSSSPEVTRHRTFREIAEDPSPSKVGDVDVDIGLMTKDDADFQSLIEGSSPIGPAQKRRRGLDGRAIRLGHLEPNTLPRPTRKSFGSSQASSQPLDSTVNNIVSDQNMPPSGTTDVRSNATTSPRRAEKRISETVLSHASKSKGYRRRRKPTQRLRESFDGPLDTVPRVTVPVRPTTEDNSTRDTPDVGRGPHREINAGYSESPPTDSVVAPNRVFAHFNGNYAGYYPASCLAVSNNDSGIEARYKVRFDDGTVDIISESGVRRLDLKVGDTVKVDRKGIRNKSWIVNGFESRVLGDAHPTPRTPSRGRTSVSKDKPNHPETDVYGYSHILLTQKIPKGTTGSRYAANENEVLPLNSIYLTQTLWTNLKDRLYSFQPLKATNTLGLQTPSEHPSAPPTPLSRSRRLKGPFDNDNPTTIKVSKGLSTASSDLFANMVFLITNVEDATIRSIIVQHIITNGGRLLDSSFDTLFEYPALEPASPSAKHKDQDNKVAFNLKHAASSFGFTTLIADRHCRTAKYIQALALGIPCLATRWVLDCVRKSSIIGWEPYLLPSGESTFLGNAVRSRLLPPASPLDTSIQQVIANRPQFLAGSNILLIMGKGKENEAMKAYPLIAYALGASKITKAMNLDEARNILLEGQQQTRDGGGDGRVTEYDWVYFYEGEGRSSEKTARAETTLFGGGEEPVSTNHGKKRKRARDSHADEREDRGIVVKKRKTRVVGTEFVIQSLILGMPLDMD